MMTSSNVNIFCVTGPLCGELTDDRWIPRTHFPRHWPFVRGIHRWPMNSPHKGQWRGALMFSLIFTWINSWVNKSWSWWFETPSLSLWRHCNGMECGTKTLLSSIHNWRLWCQKQVSQAGISNYIPQLTVGCNYLSLPELPASGTIVHNCPQVWSMEVKEQTACAVWALAGSIKTQQKYIAERITIPHLIDMLLLASEKLQYVGKARQDSQYFLCEIWAIIRVF